MRETFYRQYEVPAAFTTSAAPSGLTVAWSAGVRYQRPHEVIARLNAVFSPAVCTFALSDDDGTIAITPIAVAYTITWGDESLPLLLGFTGAHLTSIDETVLAGDRVCLGYLHPHVARLWGHRSKLTLDDVVSIYGRTNVAAFDGKRVEGDMRVWLHRHNDAANFETSLRAAYLAASEWCLGAISLTDRWGDVSNHVVVEGWEFAPESLDEETVSADMSTVAWEDS